MSQALANRIAALEARLVAPADAPTLDPAAVAGIEARLERLETTVRYLEMLTDEIVKRIPPQRRKNADHGR